MGLCGNFYLILLKNQLILTNMNYSKLDKYRFLSSLNDPLKQTFCVTRLNQLILVEPIDKFVILNFLKLLHIRNDRKEGACM